MTRVLLVDDHTSFRQMLAFLLGREQDFEVVGQQGSLAEVLRDAGVTVIGGFHSPMEKECLALLLRGSQPVVVCPARSIERMRLPGEWKRPLAEGRPLLLSPFQGRQRRATAERARVRNELVASLTDEVFVAYAAPGGKTEQFCRQLLREGERLLTLDDPDNAGLVTLGARPVRPGDYP